MTKGLALLSTEAHCMQRRSIKTVFVIETNGSPYLLKQRVCSVSTSVTIGSKIAIAYRLCHQHSTSMKSQIKVASAFVSLQQRHGCWTSGLSHSGSNSFSILQRVFMIISLFVGDFSPWLRSSLRAAAIVFVNFPCGCSSYDKSELNSQASQPLSKMPTSSRLVAETLSLPPHLLLMEGLASSPNFSFSTFQRLLKSTASVQFSSLLSESNNLLLVYPLTPDGCSMSLCHCAFLSSTFSVCSGPPICTVSSSIRPPLQHESEMNVKFTPSGILLTMS